MQETVSPPVFRLFFHGQVNEGTHVVLQDNIVAGYERVAYRINGEPCPGNRVTLAEKQYNKMYIESILA